MFSRTGLSNLLNKIYFTFDGVPCLILGLFRCFFTGVHQFRSSVTRGWVGGRRRGAGRGGEGRAKTPQGEDTGPPVAIRWS